MKLSSLAFKVVLGVMAGMLLLQVARVISAGGIRTGRANRRATLKRNRKRTMMWLSVHWTAAVPCIT